MTDMNESKGLTYMPFGHDELGWGGVYEMAQEHGTAYEGKGGVKMHVLRSVDGLILAVQKGSDTGATWAGIESILVQLPKSLPIEIVKSIPMRLLDPASDVDLGAVVEGVNALQGPHAAYLESAFTQMPYGFTRGCPDASVAISMLYLQKMLGASEAQYVSGVLSSPKSVKISA